MIEEGIARLDSTPNYRPLRWLLCTLKKPLYKIDLQGQEHLQALGTHLEDSAAIVYLNHVFLADAALVIAQLLEDIVGKIVVIAAPNSRWHYDFRRSPLQAVILRIAKIMGISLFPIVQHYDRESYSSREHLRLMKKMISGSRRLLNRPGTVVIIAPEGTRAPHNALQRAQVGIVHLARYNPDVWLVPVAVIPERPVSRGLNPGIQLQIRFGEPLRLPSEMLAKGQQTTAANHLMHRLAALLPERMRGVYAESPPGT